MKAFRELKSYIRVFLPLLILFTFSGCSAIKLPQYELKETYSEKQVLVYDKTISLPTKSYISKMKFSPTNKDELVMSLLDTYYQTHHTDRFIVMDLKSGKVKKDMKLDNNRYIYSIRFTFSDDGEKLYLRDVYENGSPKDICKSNKEKCQESFRLWAIYDKFTILDLDTGELSPYYSYNCRELIPKNLNNVEDGIEADCSVNKSVYFRIDLLKSNFIDYKYKDEKGFGSGIAVLDKDSFKPKKIITADNRLDTEFNVEIISEDGQYVLFEKIIMDSKRYKTNKKYVVYDLKNDKAIHSFDAPFPINGRAEAFIDKDTLVFSVNKPKEYLGIINLVTNEKKIFSDCGGGKCMLSTGGVYNLNDRYMMWRNYSNYYVFDKKDMKIFQEFKGAANFTVSRDFKKVAFYTINNDLYLYDISQGE
ncbi:hypothetical protein ACNSOS_10120 [Aliarcobacter vitoriensis]|uniref:hypothetical protein n=1 Tax=Aliarcobacter vitoriensis TaxID=2011099 RepID=UPI003AAA935C